jgi:5-methylcytosine-specific restriction endonuclease McrA
MTKTCTKCQIDRPVSDFANSKGKQRRPDDLHPSCRICRNAYYQANRERILAQYREYRNRPENASRILRQHKDYSTKRFFYTRANNLKIRTQSNDGTATVAEVSRLWKTQRGLCPITGRRLNRDNAQLDHIVPLKQGGSDLVDNLRWVHRDVNYAKRDLLDDDFFRLCTDVVVHLKL